MEQAFLVKLSKDKVTSTDLKQLELNGPRLIEPRTHECEHHVQAKFYKYFKYGTEILKHQPIIDLSETYFPQDVDLSQRLFSLPIKIDRASFAGSLSLNMSLAKEFIQITDTLICGDLSGEDLLAQAFAANALHVGGRFSLSRKAEIYGALALDRVNARVLDLSGSTIEGETVVSNSNIRALSAENLVTPILDLTSVSAKTVRFDYATFDQGLLKELETEDEASFRNVKVEDTFKLTNSTIRGGATFDGLTVSSKAAFIEGNELTNASFNEAVFKNSTDFTGTRFRGSAPRFFGATLHEDTIFETARENYPETSTRNLDRDIHAYGRLRLYAKQQDRPDEEHFFMRLEMRCKEARASRFYRILYWLYRQLSDYGYSVGRPLAGLCYHDCVWMGVPRISCPATVLPIGECRSLPRIRRLVLEHILLSRARTALPRGFL